MTSKLVYLFSCRMCSTDPRLTEDTQHCFMLCVHERLWPCWSIFRLDLCLTHLKQTKRFPDFVYFLDKSMWLPQMAASMHLSTFFSRFCSETPLKASCVSLSLAGWNELLIASFSHRSISVKDGILLATGLHVHRNSAHSAGVGAIFDRWVSAAFTHLCRRN